MLTKGLKVLMYISLLPALSIVGWEPQAYVMNIQGLEGIFTNNLSNSKLSERHSIQFVKEKYKFTEMIDQNCQYLCAVEM